MSRIMKPRHKKLTIIIASVAALGLSAILVLDAFQSNLVFFFSPTQVAANEAPQGKSFRIGGLVEEGSVKRQSDGVTVNFVVTDTAKVIPVYIQVFFLIYSKKVKGWWLKENFHLMEFFVQMKCWLNMMKIICHQKLPLP